MSMPLLDISDLCIKLEATPPIDLVDHISLTIPRGKVIALVGESGCGKSLTALSILRLLPQPTIHVSSGRILWHDPDRGIQTARPVVANREFRFARRPLHNEGALGQEPQSTPTGTRNLLDLSGRELRTLLGRDIAMVFQEPMTALNPVFSVGEQIVEVLVLHGRMNKKDAWREAASLLDQVGIPDSYRRVRDYPHQFSGGMRQRILIAIAIACRPQLLIADEPTTALDVTIQAQILDLLRDLRSQTGMSILLITHDLGVVAQLADEVYVMYAGRIVEHADVKDLFASPLHPYTKGLFACTPRLDRSDAPLRPIPGTVPDPARFPGGCRFHPRCDLSALRATPSRHSLSLDSGLPVLRRCVEQYPDESSGPPPLREIRPRHFAACWEVST